MKTITSENRRKNGRPSMSETKKDKIVEMYINKMPITDIMRECNISRTTIYRILKEREKK